MTPEESLDRAGHSLPALEDPAFDYAPIVVHDGVAWLAGQLAKEGGHLPVQGRAGAEVDDEEVARQAARCALQALARLRQALGALDRVERVLQMNVWVACTHDYTRISWVADRASGILTCAFSDAGRHPRSVLGVVRLPQNAPVMIDLRAAVRLN